MQENQGISCVSLNRSTGAYSIQNILAGLETITGYVASIRGHSTIYGNHLIDPQFTDDDVVYISEYFRPGVVVSCLMEHQVCRTCTQVKQLLLH